MSDDPPFESMDKELMPSKPKIPPKCRKCGEEWVEDEEESSEFHKVYEPQCQCYKRDIKLSVG